MSNSQDDIKNILSKVRLLIENSKEKVLSYRIDNNILMLHGERAGTFLTEEEKKMFVDTVNDFLLSVSNVVEFYPLNIYKDTIDWSGNIKSFNLEFIISIGNINNIYISSDNSIVDDEYSKTVENLRKFYDKFKEKWFPFIIHNPPDNTKEE